MVNDDFDGAATLVTYCPLCRTGMVFDVEHLDTDSFGVSGLLYNSDVLLYDRKTESLWSQIMGPAVSGPMKNALAANAIRPFAVGRRNWLFADTSRDARASATAYSLIETAKANGLAPYDYLRHVLTHIAAADTVEQIDALLPWNAELTQQSE